MSIGISFDKVDRIKRELRTLLPNVKSSHRTEAMARGLGFATNAGLRVALGEGLTHCLIHPERFKEYLAEHGFAVSAEDLITATIKAGDA